MIPSAQIGQNIIMKEQKDQSTFTYQVDFEKKRVKGYADGQAAMRQAIYKILKTERFAYRIYSWNYGIELNHLFGQSYAVIESEIKKIIRDALLEDRRIRDIYDFKVSQINKRAVQVDFTAATVFGSVPVSTEVGLNV